jgi:hypothetical protein
MATFTKSNSDNFLTWQKVNGALPLSDLQARGIPDCFESYNINDITFNQELNLAADSSVPKSIFWSDDGLNFYFTGTDSGQKVFQKSVSTPYDINTVVSTQTKTIAEDIQIFDVRFLSDGSKCYISGKGNKSIYQYSLSTAWDISTLSYDSKSIDCSGDTVTIDGFTITDNKVYVGGRAEILQYSITNGDLSTSSLDGAFGLGFNLVNSIHYRSEEKLYFVGSDNDSVYELTMNAGNVTTGRITKTEFVGFNPYGIFFNEGGFTMWLMDSPARDLREYWVGCP